MACLPSAPLLNTPLTLRAARRKLLSESDETKDDETEFILTLGFGSEAERNASLATLRAALADVAAASNTIEALADESEPDVVLDDTPFEIKQWPRAPKSSRPGGGGGGSGGGSGSGGSSEKPDK